MVTLDVAKRCSSDDCVDADDLYASTGDSVDYSIPAFNNVLWKQSATTAMSVATANKHAPVAVRPSSRAGGMVSCGYPLGPVGLGRRHMSLNFNSCTLQGLDR
jgi:hypothetical protein